MTRHRPVRVALAIALGAFLTVALGVACHELWYRCASPELLQSFHVGLFGSRFRGEFAHPEVPKAEDLPFWSVPAAALSALGMSAVLRRSLVLSMLAGGGLALLLRLVLDPAQYGWSAPRIDLLWALAGAIGAAVPPLLRLGGASGQRI
jgi:hypothetical protein